MNRAVWTFPLQLTAAQQVEMPDGAQILCVQLQRNIIKMWALCDPAARMVRRFIQIAGTGPAEVPNSARYLGTVQIDAGMWHVFEVSA